MKNTLLFSLLLPGLLVGLSGCAQRGDFPDSLGSLSLSPVAAGTSAEAASAVLPDGRTLTANEVARLNALKDQALALRKEYDGSAEGRERLREALRAMLAQRMGPGYDDLAGSDVPIDGLKLAGPSVVGYYMGHPVKMYVGVGYTWTWWWCQSYFELALGYEPPGYSVQRFDPNYLEVSIRDDATNVTMTYDSRWGNSTNWRSAGSVDMQLITLGIEGYRTFNCKGNDWWWHSGFTFQDIRLSFRKDGWGSRSYRWVRGTPPY